MDWNTIIPGVFEWLKSDPLVVVCVALGWMYWSRDKDLKASQEARIKNAERFAEVAERQTGQNEDMVKAVTSMSDRIRRMEG